MIATSDTIAVRLPCLQVRDRRSGRTFFVIGRLRRTIYASEDIGRLAAAFVRSRGFRARNRGLLERSFARLAEGEGKTEVDLLSYLLFDGRFTRALIDLGWTDAQRRHDELVGFFAAILDGHAVSSDGDRRRPARAQKLG